MYSFDGKATKRELVVEVLALKARPLSKKELSKACHTNVSASNCLPELKKRGAVKELQDGRLVLHSALFRSSVLLHLHLRAEQDPHYAALIAAHREEPGPQIEAR